FASGAHPGMQACAAQLPNGGGRDSVRVGGSVPQLATPGNDSGKRRPGDEGQKDGGEAKDSGTTGGEGSHRLLRRETPENDLFLPKKRASRICHNWLRYSSEVHRWPRASMWTICAASESSQSMRRRV